MRGRVLSLVLAFSLVVSVGVIFWQYWSASKSSESAEAFTFVWSSQVQNITPYDLRLEMTFKWEGENLSIVAKINDNDYLPADYLGLVFDKNHNNQIDLWYDDHPYQFFVNNMSKDSEIILTSGGYFSQPSGGEQWWEPRPSPYHVCTFDNATGYTFKIALPKAELNITNSKVHMVFYDEWNFDWVYVQFMFEG